MLLIESNVKCDAGAIIRARARFIADGRMQFFILKQDYGREARPRPASRSRALQIASPRKKNQNVNGRLMSNVAMACFVDVQIATRSAAASTCRHLNPRLIAQSFC
jgi:hypothetical protein